MAESDTRKLLAPLTLRSDVPQDAREAISAAIQGTSLSTDVWIYRAVENDCLSQTKKGAGPKVGVAASAPASAWGGFSAIEPRVLPELECDWKWIDVELLPPCGLITRAMKLAVMNPANRHGELVAHSVSQRTRLGKREVMRIRRHAAAHKTGLPQHEPPVALIAQPDGFAQRMDHPAARSLFGHLLTDVHVRSASRYEVLVGDSMSRQVRGRSGRVRPDRGPAIAGRQEPCLKPLFDNFGIYRCQGVLGRQISLRPDGRLIRRTDSQQFLEQALPKHCRLFRRKSPC
jgi:hypothetical protein